MKIKVLKHDRIKQKIVLKDKMEAEITINEFIVDLNNFKFETEEVELSENNERIYKLLSNDNYIQEVLYMQLGMTYIIIGPFIIEPDTMRLSRLIFKKISNKIEKIGSLTII